MAQLKRKEEKKQELAYQEWFKVTFLVRKPKKTTVVSLVNTVRSRIDDRVGQSFDFKNLVIEGMVDDYAYQNKETKIGDRIPIGMWRTVYKNTPSLIQLDVSGNIDAGEESTAEQ